jgi:hypothetical protein
MGALERVLKQIIASVRVRNLPHALVRIIVRYFICHRIHRERPWLPVPLEQRPSQEPLDALRTHMNLIVEGLLTAGSRNPESGFQRWLSRKKTLKRCESAAISVGSLNWSLQHLFSGEGCKGS